MFPGKMMSKFKKIIFLVILVSLTFPLNAKALKINSYDPARHDRFLSGTYASSPVNNSTFYASQYDWSGVGWETSRPTRSIALISPLHFVGANHYKIPVRNSVTFFNTEGNLKSYVVDGYTTLDYSNPSGNFVPDLVLGKLSAPVPETDNIKYYSVLDSDPGGTPGNYSNQWFKNREILSYGWAARVGRDTIDSFAFVGAHPFDDPSDLTQCFVYQQGTTQDEPMGQGGDSGSPSFMAWNNKLTVLGMHYMIDDNHRNYDPHISPYISLLNDAMTSSGYSVNTIVVPEPSTILLLGIGLFCVFGLRRKFKK